MTQNRIRLRRRLYLVALLILLAGFASAFMIYLNASDLPDNAMVEEFLNSKGYRHELEAYGGKINVLADEMSRWFSSLWHGKTLAYTVACITVVVSGGVAVFARSTGHSALKDQEQRSLTTEDTEKTKAVK